MTNSKILGNSAIYGGGILNDDGTLTLSNSIVAKNAASSSSRPDVYEYRGTFTGFNNLIGNGTRQTGLVNGVDGNLVGTSENLDIIRANWGATPTAAGVDAAMEEIAPRRTPGTALGEPDVVYGPAPAGETAEVSFGQSVCFDRTVGFWPRPGMPGCESEMRGWWVR